MITDQHPLDSPFGPASTADEVLAGRDLTGRLALITGGASGLGRTAAMALVRAGARVVLGVRRPEAARSTVGSVPGVEFEELDLTDLGSVKRFADRFLASGRRLDLVINNAGVMACPETRTAQGWELQFATNHLGHFALINRLWPALRDGQGSRIVSVSSGAHHNSAIRWGDLNFSQGYNKWLAYGQSKTANVLFAVHLDQLGREFGVRAFSLHPGKILTPLQRHLEQKEMVDAGWIDAEGRLLDPSFKTPDQGAATHVWTAVSPQLEGLGGIYCEDCNVAEVAPADHPGGGGVNRHAVDPAEAERLWALSAELTGTNLKTSARSFSKTVAF